MSGDSVEVTIRPAAVLPVAEAAKIVKALEERDVARGGEWNITVGLWQRYDKPWDGPRGKRGTAELVGTIGVVYDRPRRHEITVFKATLTEAGTAAGWSAERLCDDALAHAGLTLASCPRDVLGEPPPPDPFYDGDDDPAPHVKSLTEILRMDVRELIKMRR